MEWPTKWIMLVAGILLFGCAPMKDVQILDYDINMLHAKLTTIQKERDSLANELRSLRKETQNDISRLRTELASLRMESQRNISTLQKGEHLLRTDVAIDVKKIEADLLIQFENLQYQLKTIEKERDSLKNDLAEFRAASESQFSTLQSEDKVLRTSFAIQLKDLGADLLLRIENLQPEIRNLSTGFEEYKEFMKKAFDEQRRSFEESKEQSKESLKRSSNEMERLRGDFASRVGIIEEKGRSYEEKNRVQGDRMTFLEERFNRVEDRFKGLEEKTGQVMSKLGELERAIPAERAPVVVEVKKPKTGEGDLYKDAYGTFQKGDLEGGRRKFEAFLKQFPDTELSDNAQFWLGETYFAQKDFEKAILEYEKVNVRYPESDKLPAALLKQAFAFLELGDKANATSLLKRVIERYPRSEEASLAKKRLEGTK